MSTTALLEILLGVLLTISAIATVAVLWPGRPRPRLPLPPDPPPTRRPPETGTRRPAPAGRRGRAPVSARRSGARPTGPDRRAVSGLGREGEGEPGRTRPTGRLR
ncbi:hypothetical protein [Streptosporangium sp. NPDC002721]|uniref:hypothetical protein n=1 Tax=Streptosporangium sp. NPDC002721 TaxID=3366188 RepID=UPI0036AB5859